MQIFDGKNWAAEKEVELRQQVAELPLQPVIGAILFSEDAGSQLYTRLKKEAAERVGVGYSIREFSINDSLDYVAESVHRFNLDHEITGIIIQKPTKKVWERALEENRGEEPAEFAEYQDWWSALTALIDPEKDVDGLHPSTLAAIERGDWQEQGRVLPATAQAVLEIVDSFCASQSNFQPAARISAENAEIVNGVGGGRSADLDHKSVAKAHQEDHQPTKSLDLARVFSCLAQKKVIILGKSDLLGKPLYYLLKNGRVKVEMIGSQQLQQRIRQGVGLSDADVVISATGRPGLVIGEQLKPGVMVIDVGEPQGDVDFESVKDKAAFVTPVPGGVGPMTVVSLLQNVVKLAKKP